MIQIPSKLPDPDSVQPMSITPSTEVASYSSAASAPGTAEQQLGGAVTNDGLEVQRMALQAQDALNRSSALDGYRQLRQQQLDLQTNQQTGYENVTGAKALDPTIWQDYKDKFDDATAQIAASLPTGAARTIFGQQAAAESLAFQTNMMQHRVSAANMYQDATTNAAIDLNKNIAGLDYNKPLSVSMARANTISTVNDWLQRNNIPPDSPLAANKTLQALSPLHEAVVKSYLTNQDTAGAMDYYNKFGGEMTAGAKVQLAGPLNAAAEQHAATVAVTNATQHFQTQLTPPPFSQLLSIRDTLETRNGKDFNPDGTPVTSPAGALYKNQVLPTTAAAPGFGIKPVDPTLTGAAKAADYNRVGDQYLEALVNKYNDPLKALAAYNMGPSAFDSGPAKKGAQWESALPAETSAYVANARAMLTAGPSKNPTVPTQQDMDTYAVAQLGPTPSDSLVQRTLQQSAHAHAAMVSSFNQQGDQAVQAAQRTLTQSNGDMTALTPTQKQAILDYKPEAMQRLPAFAKSVDPANNVETNPAEMNSVLAHPEIIGNMAGSDFNQLLMTQFAPHDRQRVQNIRAQYQNPQSDNSLQNVDLHMMNAILSQRGGAVGIDVNPAKTDQTASDNMGRVRGMLMDGLVAQQTQQGHKLTQTEMENNLDGAIATNITVKGMLWGDNTSKFLTTVSQDDLTALKSTFTQAGITNPTVAQLAQAYSAWKNKTGKVK